MTKQLFAFINKKKLFVFSSDSLLTGTDSRISTSTSNLMKLLALGAGHLDDMNDALCTLDTEFASLKVSKFNFCHFVSKFCVTLQCTNLPTFDPQHDRYQSDLRFMRFFL